MKLWLLRHAHAELQHPSGRDLDRRLDPAGRSACHQLQDWMRELPEGRPQQVLVSPAQRTQETATFALAHLDFPPAVIEPRLWNATAGDLLDLIQTQQPAAQALLLIGHNPGLEDLLRWLTGRFLPSGMKPGMLVVLNLSPPLQPGCGRMEHIFQPKASI